MPIKGNFSRRSFLKTSSAAGVTVMGATLGSKSPFAQSGLPDPQTILDQISISQYVKPDYQALYGMSDSKPLWDKNTDWIRTADWEEIRRQLAGTTVRFAIGAADRDSAAAGLAPFEALSGIKVELVPIPDDSFYDKAIAEFISGNASFDALQFFSPWLGDFAARAFWPHSMIMLKNGVCHSATSTTRTA
nr:twin-arginine translocation signal domain-containing protein [Marinicella sp. W31]MDC2878602.1 extracellular solute-binding protein [Marinicella sp. W31]